MTATQTGANPNLKEQVGKLEGDIKTAFKEERYADVKALAIKLATLDPKNHVVTLLLEKVVKAEQEAKALAKEKKVADYETMLSKLFKEGKLQEARSLAVELKNFAPESKSPAKWSAKIDEAEAEAKKKANADKIKAVEQGIEKAFKEKRFDEVKALAAKMMEMDPRNKLTTKIVGKIEEAKAEAEKQAKREKVEGLEKTLKQTFNDNKFEDVRKIAAKIQETDKENSAAKKYVGCIAEAEKELQRERNAEKINALQDQIKQAFKELRFMELRQTATKLLEIDKENSFAKSYLKKVEIIELKAKGQYVGFWDKVTAWFKKPAKEAKPAPVMSVTPVAAAPKAVTVTPAPVLHVTAPAAPVAVTAPAPTPAPAPSPLKIAPTPAPAPVAAKPAEKPVVEGGNVFTKLFGKKEEVRPVEKPTKSIIDTIVAKTPEKAAVKKVEEKPNEGVGFLVFSRAFLQFAVVFVLISAGFFYVENMDADNRVLGLVGVGDNYASRLHAAAQELDAKKAEEEKLNREDKKYQAGYNNQYEQTVKKIIEGRMNWPDILGKINEVTNVVYERNEVSQYVKYNNYSFDAEKGTITVSGTLQDPLGKNLTKMLELEEAFRYYPKDKSNPEDVRKPYFYDFKEFKSLSKTYDQKSGKFTSNFQLSFALHEPATGATP